jgi:hypothetical protein
MSLKTNNVLPSTTRDRGCVEIRDDNTMRIVGCDGTTSWYTFPEKLTIEGATCIAGELKDIVAGKVNLEDRKPVNGLEFVGMNFVTRTIRVKINGNTEREFTFEGAEEVVMLMEKWVLDQRSGAQNLKTFTFNDIIAKGYSRSRCKVVIVAKKNKVHLELYNCDDRKFFEKDMAPYVASSVGCNLIGALAGIPVNYDWLKVNTEGRGRSTTSNGVMMSCGGQNGPVDECNVRNVGAAMIEAAYWASK